MQKSKNQHVLQPWKKISTKQRVKRLKCALKCLLAQNQHSGVVRKIARSLSPRSPLFAKLTRTSAKFSIFKFYFNVSNQFRHFWLSPPNGDTFQIQTNTPPRLSWLILILQQPLQFVLFALRDSPVIYWLPHAISNISEYFKKLCFRL